MMPFPDKLFLPRTIAGVEIVFLPGSIIYNLVVAHRNRNKISIVKHKSGITEPKEITTLIPAHVPLHVIVSGKGILVREIPCDESSTPQQLLSKILPNATPGDFHLHHSRVINGKCFASVIRKETLFKALNDLKQLNLHPVNVSCGPIVLENLVPFLENVYSMKSSVYDVHFSGDTLSRIDPVEFNSSPDKISFGNEQIHEQAAIALAGVIREFVGQSNESGTNPLEEEKEDFRQRSVFRKSVALLLSIIFMILLGNYFFFSHYWSLKNELEGKLDHDGGAFDRLQSLQAQLDSRKAFLTRSGLIGKVHCSWYADRIAMKLPAGIKLKQMQLAPKVNSASEDSIGFTHGEIAIDGNCQGSLTLNEWIGTLKSENWINGVTLQHFNQDRSMNTGEFSLLIQTQ